MAKKGQATQVVEAAVDVAQAEVAIHGAAQRAADEIMSLMVRAMRYNIVSDDVRLQVRRLIGDAQRVARLQTLALCGRQDLEEVLAGPDEPAEGAPAEGVSAQDVATAEEIREAAAKRYADGRRRGGARGMRARSVEDDEEGDGDD